MKSSRIPAYACIAVVILLWFLFPAYSHAEEDIEKRERRFIPFPVFFITPETGFGLGASLLYYISPFSDAVVQQPDLLSAVAFYTQNNQWLTALGMEKYFRQSGNKLNVAGVVQKFPDKFWGIGPVTPDEFEENYTPFEVSFGIGYQWYLSRGFFLGPVYSFAYIDMKEVEEDGLLDTGFITGSEGTRASGVGLRFTADRRDSPFFPRRGFLLDSTVMIYSALIGSEEDFSQFLFDYRHFFPLFERHVLGLQYVLQLSTGDVPFQYLPEMGGRFMMRGYYEGRYRDMNYTALQGEYRLPLFWRLGAVVFGSVGQVAPNVNSLVSLEHLRVTGGFGIRFLIEPQRQINFRIDIAYNGKELVPYFNVLEAF